MLKAWGSLVVLLGLWAVAQPFTAVEAQLNPFFYLNTCPQLFPLVALGVYNAILINPRNAASLLRLHFHDCFVQGCDASVLLDATATIPSEKTAIPNLNSLRGFDIIDSIKATLEAACPNVVSCADIVTLSAFFSVILSGGPAWVVPLGRRDSFTAASATSVLTDLPAPFDNISNLKSKFAALNLTTTDLVALSGGHTIGLARCTTLISRLYNFSSTAATDPTLNSTLAATLKNNCPFGGDGNVTNPLDIQTPRFFDNLYYKNLLQGNGLFQSDEELVTAASDTDALVQTYAASEGQFFSSFSASIVKMGNLSPLTGTAGEIRKNCRVRNPVTDISAEEERIVTAVKEMEGAQEYFEKIVKQAMQTIIDKELGGNLEKLVVNTNEETIGATHSST